MFALHSSWIQIEFKDTMLISDCGVQRDVAIVLDASGSVNYDYDLAQQLARLVVHGLNLNQDRMRVSVLTYQNAEQVAIQHIKFTIPIKSAF